MLPVNLISGFLGAGKTSVLVDCLDHLEGVQNVAVIENEFGNINVDAVSLQGKARYIYELSNGCICCSLQDELDLLLDSLADVKPLDRIIIEPSGVFIIDSIVDIFKQPNISERFYIESISVVVDAISFPELAHLPFVCQQIKMANIVVINKIDQCEKIDSIVGLVKQIKPESKILLRANKLEKRCVKKLLVPQQINLSKQMIAAHQFTTHILEANKFNEIKQLEEYLINKGKTLLRAKGSVQIQGQYFEVSYTLSEFKYWPIKRQHTVENNLVLIYR